MKSYNKLTKIAAPVLAAVILGSCSDDFVKPDPLSFFEPEATFTTESGLQAALAITDRHLRRHMISENTNTIPLLTEYEFSEMAVCGKTDWGSGFQDNWADNLTPTSWMSSGFNDGAMAGWMWYNMWDHVKYANTVLDYVDKVESLDQDIKNEYKGRGYFHRAWAYYNLVFEYGDIPLVTCLPTGPKQDYRSVPKMEIMKMMAENLKEACEWVPAQKDMAYYGMINKEACMMLYAKVLLSIGEFKKAEQVCTELIDNLGHSLMKSSFGQFVETAAPETWPVQRNVIWDLHRPENKIIAANTETLLGMPNCTEQSFQGCPMMRVVHPHFSNTVIKDAKGGTEAIKRNTKAEADPKLDYIRAFGRGIGIFRATYFAQHSLWVVNGVEDTQDLRHNSASGNWVNMEDMKVSNPKSKCLGQNLALYAPEDVLNSKGKPVIEKGDLLCTDTLRSWFDFPLYKTYYRSAADDENPDSNDYQGSSKGSNSNFYLYRLAEAYLVRAEAYVHQGQGALAANDLNEIRRRANCSQFYTTANIGDVMNERARELYLEEFRKVELVRASMCLAISGQPDEWGNTYSLSNWDKQVGTDAVGGSYWYQRLYHYSFYGRGNAGEVIKSAGNEYRFKMDKHNLYWPVPHDAGVGNKNHPLWQNYGYDGHDPNVEMWATWQEADEASHN